MCIPTIVRPYCHIFGRLEAVLKHTCLGLACCFQDAVFQDAFTTPIAVMTYRPAFRCWRRALQQIHIEKEIRGKDAKVIASGQLLRQLIKNRYLLLGKTYNP